MRKNLLFLLLLLFGLNTYSQVTDFIVIKKKNNRTLKTYYPGTFINAETYDGHLINGIIKAIRNDSIIFQQQETRMTPTEFGMKLDTVSYSMSVEYHFIKKFNFTAYTPTGRKKGFVQVTLPKLLIIGGVGFIGLELINTAYRKESINENNKLASLGIAAGVAATGFAWNYISKHRNRVGGKYKVVYVKGTTN